MKSDKAWAEEFLSIYRSSLPRSQKYLAYFSLVDRIAKEETEDYAAQFTSLYSRLYAIGQQRGFSVKHIDTFRYRARRVFSEELSLDDHDFGCDEQAVADFVQRMSGVQLPFVLQLSEEVPSVVNARLDETLRAVVTGVEGSVLKITTEQPSDVQAVDASLFPEVLAAARVGTQLNLLGVSVTPDAPTTADIIIYEPDYLIDVSSLSACFQEQGCHPFNYVLQKLEPRATSAVQLLGDAANQFIDDSIYAARRATSVDYEASMLKAFRQNPLGYLACDECELNAKLYARAELHFRNIETVVHQTFTGTDVGIQPDDVVLEPSFICEALGLRGRFDLMTLDNCAIVELKSGRAEDFRCEPHPRQPHALQMALYKEMLFHNMHLRRSSISSYLLYSVYPLLYNCRVSLEEVKRALALRNQIVVLEQQLRDGLFPRIVASLTPEVLNQRHLTGRLYTDYILPRQQRMLDLLKGADPLEAAYFNAFLTFLQREQFLAKMGDNRADSSRGFANVWTMSRAEKRAAGTLLEGLRLLSTGGDGAVEYLVLTAPAMDEVATSNLNVGDRAQLYSYAQEADGATSRQLFRGTIEQLDDRQLRFRLSTPQRNARVFPPELCYAIEPDYTDTFFTSCYRGLTLFLQAPPRRRSLLLGRRDPEFRSSVQLLGHYLNPAIEAVVLAAKQASDYYLLIGPPGSGKTSIALSAMVQEFRLTHEADGANLLLAAYTNRAVDEICEMLTRLPAAPDFVRIGSSEACASAYRSSMMEENALRFSSPHDFGEWFSTVHVVVGTVASLSSHTDLFRLKTFAAAFIDEASQLLEPHLLPLLSVLDSEGCPAIGKFILVGDPKQLPAVVMQPEAQTQVRKPLLLEAGFENLSQSLFQRWQSRANKRGLTAAVGLLDVQGRMHTRVAAFANDAFYGGLLSAVPGTFQHEALTLSATADVLSRFVCTHRTGFVNVDLGPERLPNPKANRPEAEAVVRLLETLCAAYQRSGHPLSMDDVGIIVPFRHQIAQVRQSLLRGGHTLQPTIDTVECYQGSQREVILFSTTISRPYQLAVLSNPQQVNGTWVDRKLNVALTRARRQCFVVGNAALLSRSSIYKALLDQTPIFDFTKEEENG